MQNVYCYNSIKINLIDLIFGYVIDYHIVAYHIGYYLNILKTLKDIAQNSLKCIKKTNFFRSGCQILKKVEKIDTRKCFT